MGERVKTYGIFIFLKAKDVYSLLNNYINNVNFYCEFSGFILEIISFGRFFRIPSI